MNEMYKFEHYIGGGSKGNLQYDIYSTDDEKLYFYIISVNGREVYDSLEHGETYQQCEVDEVARQKCETYLKR